jgi:hypothetical protein
VKRKGVAVGRTERGTEIFVTETDYARARRLMLAVLARDEDTVARVLAANRVSMLDEIQEALKSQQRSVGGRF